MDYPYWHKQSVDKPLFPDIEWSKPQQKALSGRLAIIGGSSLGFISAAESYSTSLALGIGTARVLLPDVLKKNIPSSMTEVIFGKSNPSGGLSQESKAELDAIADWSTGVLMIGDAGRNSETAILYEDFLKSYQGQVVITRDAIDLIKNSTQELVERPNTLIVASFAQLQKIFQSVYYPKVLTFSMQLTNLVEALHKFTITYPVSIAVLHKETMIVANKGNISTTPFLNPMQIWRGTTATKAAVYWSWNPTKPLESTTASLLS